MRCVRQGWHTATAAAAAAAPNIYVVRLKNMQLEKKQICKLWQCCY